MRMNKVMREWTIDATWGKIAMVSWGDPANPPILLVHGYMDSAATFVLLLEQLPDIFYYVAFDMPGHGKSEPFLPGPIVSHLGIVETVRLVVKHMKWNKFVYLSHSMGFSIGIFYNHLFPGKIEKMVHIDPGPPIALYYYPHHNPLHWYQFLYDMYYSSYERWNTGTSKRLTPKEAVHLLVRNRNLTEDQAEVVLSRSLVPAGDGKFKLSWDPRMKKIATLALSEETLFIVITEHAPPTLIIESSENIATPLGRRFADSIIEKCILKVPNFYSVTVTGGHDVHITNPEKVAPHVKRFLKSYKRNSSVKCKL